MARTLTEIFDGIKANYVTERATAGLPADDPAAWSKVNLKRLICYIVAMAIYVLEQIFDKHYEEVETDLANLRPPTVIWYAEKAKAYQHGFPLLVDSDQFDNTGYTDEQIEESKVVKYAGVQKIADEDGYVRELRFKLAGEDGDELAQLPDDVVTGFKEYLERFIAAGDNVTVTSRPADKMKMKWTIYYNPGILNENGARLDGTSPTPVIDAIKAYLKDGLSFNGEYSITSHIDYVQKVQGVITPRVIACSASYSDLPFVNISEYYQPDGGWLRFENIETDLEITYIPKS